MTSGSEDDADIEVSLTRRSAIIAGSSLVVSTSGCLGHVECAISGSTDGPVEGFTNGKKIDDVPDPIPFRLFIPENYDPDQTYPVALTLHGAGARGCDNTSQLRHNAIYFSGSEIQRESPMFVLSPQCHPSKKWCEVNGWDEGTHPPREITDPMEGAIEILDEVISNYSISQNQQIVAGFSMGGYGVWDAVTRFPDRFEVALPMSGGGIPALADEISTTSVWAFHGAEDSVVPVSGTRQMIEEMRNEGLNPKYTEFQNEGHTPTPVFNLNNLPAWITEKIG